MAILIFILGLIFGSFFNVVGVRLPENKSIIKPGSHCPKCNHKLSWWENIPLLSYVILKGKCKSCEKNISLMYPIMELLTAILFIISYYLFGIDYYFYISIVISSLLILIFITDSKHMIILDEALIVCGSLIFLIKLIYEGLKVAIISIGNGLAIFLFVYILMIIGNYIFKKESLGGGDIKLSFIAGMVLGIPVGSFYVILASFLAFPYAIYVSIKNEDGMLPFGPFLITSLFLCYINHQMITEFLKALFRIN
ncbi:MAG: prepilin peptidase [Bacilli bacterium]|nr:prepilin peptidase [Bacilli bacterium]